MSGGGDSIVGGLAFDSWYITYKPHDGKTWHEGALLKTEIGAGREFLHIQKNRTLTIAIGGAYDAAVHKLLSLQAGRTLFKLLVSLWTGPAAKGAPTHSQLVSGKGRTVALFTFEKVEVITLVPKEPGFYFINLKVRGGRISCLARSEA